MKIEKTRQYYKRKKHNKNIIREQRLRNFSDSSSNKQEIKAIEYKEEKEEIKTEVAPNVISPKIPENNLLDILKDPKKMLEFKKFQEFLKVSETQLQSPTPPTSPAINPIDIPNIVSELEVIEEEIEIDEYD